MLVPVDDHAFQAAMDAMNVRVEVASKVVLGKIGGAIVAKSMAWAPVKQGTLRRSIFMDGPVSASAGIFAVRVGPSVIYARRIELGFDNMRDSLGRLYHQKPKPYFEPAKLEVLAEAPAMLRGAVAGALRV